MSTLADTPDQPVQEQNSNKVFDHRVISFDVTKNSNDRAHAVAEYLAACQFTGMPEDLQSAGMEHPPSPHPLPQTNPNPLLVNFTKYTPGPITHLPVEMVMEIFKHATYPLNKDLGIFDQRSNVLDPSWIPYSVSQVCHRWRTIAIEDCPKIWASFSLDWNVSHWDRKNDPVTLLSLVLSRSGNAPLEFRLDEEDFHGENEIQCGDQKADGGDDDDEDKDTWNRPRNGVVTEEIIRVLIKQCHRWQNVCISIPADSFHLLSPIHGRLCALVFLEFNEADGFSTTSKLPSRIVSNILDSAPLLDSLVIPSFSGVLRPKITIIPRMCRKFHSFANFRAGRVGDALHRHFLDIIANSPSMNKFDVRLTGFFRIAGPRIVNTSITTVCSGSFLCSITIPKLKEVHLCPPAPGSHLYIHNGIGSLYDLVTHSGFSLTSLTTECAVDERLISILRVCPKMTTLTLSLSSWCGNSMQTILSLMAELGKAETDFLPKLESFYLCLPKGTSFLPEMEPLFMNWVDSIENWWGNVDLELSSVGFKIGSFSDQETERGFILPDASRDRLITMEIEGLSVSIVPGYLYEGFFS